jgi:hypothetical protein
MQQVPTTAQNCAAARPPCFANGKAASSCRSASGEACLRQAEVADAGLSQAAADWAQVSSWACSTSSIHRTFPVLGCRRTRACLVRGLTERCGRRYYTLQQGAS